MFKTDIVQEVDKRISKLEEEQRKAMAEQVSYILNFLLFSGTLRIPNITIPSTQMALF